MTSSPHESSYLEYLSNFFVVEDVKRRIQTLRTGFKRELNKIKESPSGCKYKPKTPRRALLVKRLQFLEAFQRGKQSKSNVRFSKPQTRKQTLSDSEGTVPSPGSQSDSSLPPKKRKLPVPEEVKVDVHPKTSTQLPQQTLSVETAPLSPIYEEDSDIIPPTQAGPFPVPTTSTGKESVIDNLPFTPAQKSKVVSYASTEKDSSDEDAVVDKSPEQLINKDEQQFIKRKRSTINYASDVEENVPKKKVLPKKSVLKGKSVPSKKTLKDSSHPPVNSEEDSSSSPRNVEKKIRKPASSNASVKQKIEMLHFENESLDILHKRHDFMKELQKSILEDQDEISVWGKLVTKKVRRIEDPNTQELVMTEFIKISSEAIMGKWPPTSSSSSYSSSQQPVPSTGSQSMVSTVNLQPTTFPLSSANQALVSSLSVPSSSANVAPLSNVASMNNMISISEVSSGRNIPISDVNQDQYVMQSPLPVSSKQGGKSSYLYSVPSSHLQNQQQVQQQPQQQHLMQQHSSQATQQQMSQLPMTQHPSQTPSQVQQQHMLQCTPAQSEMSTNFDTLFSAQPSPKKTVYFSNVMG